MSGNMANYTVGNTPSADANKCQWVKMVDGGKSLLVRGRAILVNISWDDLSAQRLVVGKEITIDRARYKYRLLTGGTARRSSSDWYSGETPTNNEWGRFVTREQVLAKLPAPLSSDLDRSLNATNLSSTHNFFWNWYSIYSWYQEVYFSDAWNRADRGWRTRGSYLTSTFSNFTRLPLVVKVFTWQLRLQTEIR